MSKASEVHQLVIYDRKTEVMRFHMRTEQEACWLGRVVTRGTHWLFAVQSPIPGIHAAPGGLLKVS